MSRVLGRLSLLVPLVLVVVPARSGAQLRAACHDTVPVRTAGLVAALQAFGARVDSAPPAVRVCGLPDRTTRVVSATPGMMDA